MAKAIGEYTRDIESLVKLHQRDLFAYEQADVDRFRLDAARERFGALRDRIGALRKLADLQKVGEIKQLDDLVHVLFQHTVYKSYPMSFLEQNKFGALNKWLDQLTTHDLSGVDTDDCYLVEDWFRRIEAATPVTPIHTTGTSGKLSIIPRTERDMRQLLWSTTAMWQGFGSETDRTIDLDNPGAPRPHIHPTYLHGFYAGLRLVDLKLKTFTSPAMTEALYDDWLSPDVLSLAGRVMAAEARGQLQNLKVDPHLLQRYRQNQHRQHNKEKDTQEFFDRCLDRFAGQRVILTGNTHLLWGWVEEGQRRGMKNIFAGDSWFSTGGGLKGQVLPADWMDQCEQVLGARLAQSYTMSELCGAIFCCPHGNYHVPPYIVPFVLDENTGEALPRTGTRTGRAAFLDLLVDSYWGGFITGDEVTMNWDGGCACGRHGEYIHPTIRRFSERNGGDDKISCAGAADAQDKAMEYLARIAESA
jgi:hypothetical protein